MKGKAMSKFNATEYKARVASATDEELDGIFLEFISDLSDDELREVLVAMKQFVSKSDNGEPKNG